MAVDETVLGLWRALSSRDWEAVKTFLSADCVYVDMPVGPTLAARGPDDIVKRLKVGLEPLAGYQNHDGVLVSNGSDVMYEHSETWRWASGE
ncbi:MAG: nuclear transport factor 2 family protein, partial [Mycobacterium sp.]